MGHTPFHKKQHLTPTTTSDAESDLVCSTFASLPPEKSFAAGMPNGPLHKWPAYAFQALSLTIVVRQTFCNSYTDPFCPATLWTTASQQYSSLHIWNLLLQYAPVSLMGCLHITPWSNAQQKKSSLCVSAAFYPLECCGSSPLSIYSSQGIFSKSTNINRWWTPADKDYNSLKFYPNLLSLSLPEVWIQPGVSKGCF